MDEKPQDEKASGFGEFKRACVECLKTAIEITEEVVPKSDPHFHEYVQMVHQTLSMVVVAPLIGGMSARVAAEFQRRTGGGRSQSGS